MRYGLHYLGANQCNPAILTEISKKTEAKLGQLKDPISLNLPRKLIERKP